MKQTLQLKLGQHLTITPQLQQAISLLQLSTIELLSTVQDAVENNPLLELQENEATVETNWDNTTPCTYYAVTKPDNNWLERQAPTEDTLESYLLWQLNLSAIPKSQMLVAAFIIDAIDDNGYLQTSCAEIQSALQNNENNTFSIATIESVLKTIQQFEPLGIAARDLKECLTIQLKALPADTPYLAQTKQLVSQHLDLLAHKHYTRLKARLSLSDSALKAVINNVMQLNPRPGTLICNTKADYITPEVVVEKDGNRWVVKLNSACLPKVHVNALYKQLLTTSNLPRDKKFMQEQLFEAKWLIKSLQNRHETLLKVTSCIVEKQQAFLEHGEEAMQPLILQDIADEVGLHESTISRITSNKYLHTPRGTFELKHFLSNRLPTTHGSGCSATAIKAKIKKLVSQEKKPLSDIQLVNLLAQTGINIARRTVAKYRKDLSILPSSQRKDIMN